MRPNWSVPDNRQTWPGRMAPCSDWTTRLLQRVRDWLVRDARLIGAAIMVLLAAALLRDGISELAHMS
jgi:hypothetical protein